MPDKGIIYCITNKINGHKYIGQTRRNLKRRWQEHCWRDNDQVITKAIKKYGKENFTVEVLERCHKDKLDKREIYWIAHYNTYDGDGYNTHKGGRTLGEGKDHPRTGQKTPEEVKEKMRQTLKENGTWELRQGENHPYYGKKHPKEVIEKMSKSISKANRKNSPLNKKIALNIIKRYFEDNQKQSEIAKDFDVCKGIINKIINCRHWTMEDLEKPKCQPHERKVKQLALF